MKQIDRLTSIFSSITRIRSWNLTSTRSYSLTETTTTPTTTEINDTKQAWSFLKPKLSKDWTTELYRKINSVWTPHTNASVVPILDQWVKENKNKNKTPLYKHVLVGFIKSLRRNNRPFPALEISYWMTDKKSIPLTTSDVAIRLDLISKVHGIERAEEFFADIPKHLRGLEVYGALLNCYAHTKSVSNAETIMQRMRDLGFAETTLNYNVMLNLYNQIGNTEKFDRMLQEMEEKGIDPDLFTYHTILGACAAVPDIKRLERTLESIRSNLEVLPNWSTYTSVAKGYIRAGLVDKALEMLNKSEALATTAKTRGEAFNHIMTLYAAAGKKSEVLRLWELTKKGKVYNKGYVSVITSLLKLDDLESAEKIFELWETQNLTYDMRIPNCMISAYSKIGLLEKAVTCTVEYVFLSMLVRQIMI